MQECCGPVKHHRHCHLDCCGRLNISCKLKFMSTHKTSNYMASCPGPTYVELQSQPVMLRACRYAGLLQAFDPARYSGLIVYKDP